MSVAVMVAVWLLLTVPLVAVKVAVLWPAATVTLAGTGRVAELLASVTETGLAVTWLSDTVQVVLALLPRFEGEQETEVSWAGALAASVKL